MMVVTSMRCKERMTLGRSGSFPPMVSMITTSVENERLGFLLSRIRTPTCACATIARSGERTVDNLTFRRRQDKMDGCRIQIIESMMGMPSASLPRPDFPRHKMCPSGNGGW